MVWSLGFESHTAGNLGVRPNLALKGLDGENFVLEKHWIILNGFANSLIFSLESSNCLLLGSLFLEVELCFVIRVITVETIISTLILVLVFEHGPLFSFLLAELHI